MKDNYADSVRQVESKNIKHPKTGKRQIAKLDASFDGSVKYYRFADNTIVKKTWRGYEQVF